MTRRQAAAIGSCLSRWMVRLAGSRLRLQQAGGADAQVAVGRHAGNGRGEDDIAVFCAA